MTTSMPIPVPKGRTRVLYGGRDWEALLGDKDDE
jgi:hypothetical protein